MERKTRKQILIALGIGAGVVTLIGIAKYLQFMAVIAQASGNQMPPEAVTTIVAEEQEWPSTYGSIGSLAASRGVTIKTEEAGVVRNIYFDSGQPIEAGKPLIELDTSVEEADLRAAEATSERTRKSADRAKGLIGKQAISQADYEQAMTEFDAAKATVESLKARIARKKILAPFAGQSGIRMVNVGQYLSAGDNVVPLYTLDPLYLNFTLPQRAVKDMKPGLAVTVHVDVYPEQEFKGKVTAVNPQIDELTRNVEVQATIPNPDGLLRPGMFGRVSVILPQTNRFITIPVSSVYSLPYADTVYVVEPAKAPAAGAQQLLPTVRQQVVKLGERRGNQVAILSGVGLGEEVVTSGGFKLRPGLSVLIKNDLAPTNDPAPDPPDT